MPTSETLLIAIRAVHFGAAMVLFGEMLFAWFFARHEANSVSAPGRRDRTSASSERRFPGVAVAAWGCMLASGACWFALVAMQMSGRPLEALDWATITTVLGSTIFGRAWSVRALMALVLALIWPILRAGPRLQPGVSVLSVGIAGGLVAGLAWAGHANAEVGVDGWIHHASDAAHLLAAGAWLGGLAPLASLLRTLGSSSTRRDIDSCAETVVRFGNWAALSVAVLVLTGIANVYYLVPAPRALLETSYGNVLLVKLLLFALMLAVAAANRTRLTRALLANERDDGARVDAARRLRRNVWLEQALGAGAVLLVATLGVTPPPMRI